MKNNSSHKIERKTPNHKNLAKKGSSNQKTKNDGQNKYCKRH